MLNELFAFLQLHAVHIVPLKNTGPFHIMVSLSVFAWNSRKSNYWLTPIMIDRTTEVPVNTFVWLRQEFDNSDWNLRTLIVASR